MVYMYHSFLVHSSADGHLGCTVFMEEKFHNSIGVKKEKYKFVFIGMSKKNFISIIPSPKAA